MSSLRRPHPGVCRTRSPRKHRGHGRQGHLPHSWAAGRTTCASSHHTLAVCEPQTRTGLPCRVSLGANASVLLGAMAQGSPLSLTPHSLISSRCPAAPAPQASPALQAQGGGRIRISCSTHATQHGARCLGLSPSQPVSQSVSSVSQPASQPAIQSVSEFSQSVSQPVSQ